MKNPRINLPVELAEKGSRYAKSKGMNLTRLVYLLIEQLPEPTNVGFLPEPKGADNENKTNT